jgi:hypothetical protein
MNDWVKVALFGLAFMIMVGLFTWAGPRWSVWFG